ncbi:MAG: PKD domain-containing protein, partial [Bacteroidota bacterium]|nr:PKD domain-containing protein [Bacteroidota bacterium]
MTFANGTTSASTQPQFSFSQPGVYQVTLSISSGSCATVSITHPINIDGPPVITMSPDAAVCGTNLTYNFNPNPGTTQTTITGTAQPTASTFTWAITGNPGYSFVNGTSANSQYPQIKFTAFATYTVTVTVQNSCGTVSKSQNLTFQNAPTVTLAANAPTICPGTSTNLTATINGSYNTLQWTGAGLFSAATSPTTTYTPTAAEVNAGKATVSIDVKTSLSGQCADIQQNITINIYPVDNITSANVKQICTGNSVNYAITSTVPGSTYTWTAALTSGTASGFAGGSGASINDVLTNSTNSDAVVTYSITPQDPNGCTGSTFTLKVTVKPLSTVTAAPANNTICSGNAAGINLSPSIAGTTYTWTSTVSGNITGNSQQNTSVATNVINDVLNNTGAAQGSVTYTITPFNSTCPGAPTVVTVNVQPLPVAANAGSNDERCNITTYTLNGNTPPAGGGKWTVIPAAGVNFSDATQPNAIASGLVPGTTYSFTWTITIPGCQSSSNSVTIKDDALSVGGTTAGAATVCSGSNNGTITLSGQVGNIIRWELSTDNGATWQQTANTTASQQYFNLITTTQYRAVVQSGVCSTAFSSVSTITVNQPSVQANAGPNDAICNSTSYTLKGNSPAPFTGKWTVTAGPAGATFADATQPNTTVSGLIPGNIYQFTWTITANAPCPTNSSSVVIRVDAPTNGGATSGSTTLCGGSNNGTITLTGQVGNIIRWESSIDNGTTWQQIANTTASQQYINLTATTQYHVLIQNGACSSALSSVTTITIVQPALQANAGANQELCNATTYNLQGNNPGSSSGKWTVTAGPPGATFSDPTQPNATVTGLIPGNSYQFTWTITPSAPCAPSSSAVTIVVDPATVGGSTSGSATVCSGSNSGTITLTGQVGNILRWESSTDGTTWVPIANTNTTQQYLNLNTTTQYRVAVQSGVCALQFSTISTITVNQPAVQANAGPDQNLCGGTSATLQGNNPAPFTGVWTQTAGPAATIVTPGSSQTQVNGLIPGNDYSFVWTIQGLPPCANSSDIMQIHDAANVTPSFTADKTDNCGTYTVNFTNTSTSLTGTTFLWDFGDGSAPSNAVSPSHTYSQRNDGKDTVYTVSLSIVNNCAPHPPFTLNITVRPKNPVAAILPAQLTGCSPFSITVANKSPGNNTSYVFYLYDGANLVQQVPKTDKSSVTFNPVTAAGSSKTYTVYMVATGFCGNTTEST